MSVTEVRAPAGPRITPAEEPLESTIPIEAEILERAADIMETEGWTRGNFAVFGNRCAVGAIGAAVRRMPGVGNAERERAEEVLAKRVRPEFGYNDPKNTIISWNDSGERSKGEVVRKFREVAARLVGR